MTSDMAMNTQVIIPDGDEEIVRVVENAVQAAHTMNADTNEFNYASVSYIYNQESIYIDVT
jgi:hypothetical protein